MRELFEKYREIILYLIFGVLATVVSIGSYIIFLKILDNNALIANIISWIFAVLFAYITNRIWVFQSENSGLGNILKEMGSFFAGRIATLIMEEIILLVGISYFGINEIVIKVIAQVFVVVANYVISKLFIFSNK